jgi:hypothetical protein
MKPQSIEELVETLRARGTIAAAATPFAPPMERPWFVSIVLGGAGWLAGIFVLLFVMMLFSPDSAPGYALAGFVLLASAYGLYAADRDSAFFDQLALALSMAGQLSIAGAAIELTHSPGQTAAVILVLQCALLAFMPNRFARAIAAFFACLAWAFTIRFAWWGEDWLLDSTRAGAALVPALLGWFVIWIPLIALAFILVERESQWIARGWQHIARPALGGTLLALAFGTFVSEPFATITFLAPTERSTNWLALWPLLAIGTALFAAFRAYRLRNHALLGCAIAGALLHVVHFYLVLGTTLLIKSGIMVAIGVISLIAARWLSARIAQGESS